MLLLLVLAMTLLLHPLSALTQESGFVSDTEYVLTYGATLEWDEPWVADESESGFSMEQLGDYLVFDAGPAAYMQFATFPAVGNVASYLESVAGFIADPSGEILELESDKTHGHALVVIEQGVSTFAAVVAMFRTDDLATDQVVILLVDVRDVGKWVGSVQDTFTIDGEPILQQVDAMNAQDVFDGADGGAEAGDPDDKKIPEDPESSTGPGGNGLSGDRSYVSPQFGTVVTWNQRWIADAALATSNTSAGVDYLALNRRGGAASLYISLRDGAAMSPEEWLEHFQDDISSSADLEILDSASESDSVWVMFERDVDGMTTRGYAEAYAGENDAVVVVELSGSLDEREFAQVFDAAQASVEIDGESPFILAMEAPGWP
jgi:hypothetical protein